MIRRHRRGIERVEANQLDLIRLRVALLVRLDLVDFDLGKTAHAEDLTGSHVLQQIAHQEIGRGLQHEPEAAVPADARSRSA